jgi:hypothetical protein
MVMWDIWYGWRLDKQSPGMQQRNRELEPQLGPDSAAYTSNCYAAPQKDNYRILKRWNASRRDAQHPQCALFFLEIGCGCGIATQKCSIPARSSPKMAPQKDNYRLLKPWNTSRRDAQHPQCSLFFLEIRCGCGIETALLGDCLLRRQLYQVPFMGLGWCWVSEISISRRGILQSGERRSSCAPPGGFQHDPTAGCGVARASCGLTRRT